MVGLSFLMVTRLPHPQARHQFLGMMPPATVVPSTASVRDHVLAVLRANRGRPDTAYGVRDLRLFGSVARGEATEHSDVDLFVDLTRINSRCRLSSISPRISRRC